MKRLFTMGLALLMVLTMVPMSCHASNLDAGIGAESVMLASMTVSAVAVDKPVDMGDNQDSSLVLTSYISEDSILTCEYELTAPQDATYLQINVEQYSNGESDCLFTGGGVYWGGQSTD